MNKQKLLSELFSEISKLIEQCKSESQDYYSKRNDIEYTRVNGRIEGLTRAANLIAYYHNEKIQSKHQKVAIVLKKKQRQAIYKACQQ